MKTVLTLEDRKRARVVEIRTGVVRLRMELSEYGRMHGGSFLLFGSAATGRIHYDSDVDILVDFDSSAVAAAVDFAEAACARLKLTADVQPKSWCKEPFINKIAQSAVELPAAVI